MRRSKISNGAIGIILSFLLFPSIVVAPQLLQVAEEAASAQIVSDAAHDAVIEVVKEEPTCTLDTVTEGISCSVDTADDARVLSSDRSVMDLTGRVVSLTDDNFDELTTMGMPSTWLIMFKTNACGICVKAMPVFEALSIDTYIVRHNDRELAKSIGTIREEAKAMEEGGGHHQVRYT